VAAIGAATIFAGVGFQLLQLGYSIWKRDENRDTTGDPWGGRTLEWSTTSPPPEYNFAVIPEVTGRDAFWTMKHRRHTPEPEYTDIYVPKNTPLPLFIAASAFMCGFGIVWHIWWLAAVTLLAIIVTIIVRTSSEDNERRITAARLAKLEAGS
jgi:cytochrome o ubiquinol oxidase subunit 1